MERFNTDKIITVGLLCLALSANCIAQDQIKEIAVVNVVKYPKYNYVSDLLPCIKEAGYEPALVSEDIFLEKNKTECMKYKRIIIPAMTFLFSGEMYNGMTEYVKNGGLLISNESGMKIDVNGNYNDDSEDSYWGNEGFPLIGVYGFSSCVIEKIKILQQTPITMGLPLNEWLNLAPAAGGRECKIVKSNAVELAGAYLSDASKGYRPMKQPLLTYNHLGCGACIYIVPRIHEKMDKNLKTIFKNILSPNTLEWLTATPE